MMEDMLDQKEAVAVDPHWLRALKPPRDPLGSSMRNSLFDAEARSPITISHDGDLVIYYTSCGTVRGYSFKLQAQVFVTESFDIPVTAIAVSVITAAYAIGFENGVIEVRSVVDSTQLFRLQTSTSQVLRLQFGNDSKLLLAAFKGGGVAVFDVISGVTTAQLDLPVEVRIVAVAISTEGTSTLVFIGFEDGSVSEWDTLFNTLRQRGSFAFDSQAFYHRLAFSSDCSLVAVASNSLVAFNSSIRLFRLADGQTVGTLQPHKRWTDSISFSQSDRYLFTGSQDYTAILTDLMSEPNTHFEFAGHTGAVVDGRMASDESSVTTISSDLRIRSWRICTTNRSRPFAHAASVNCIAISPNGTLLASGSMGLEVILWQVSRGRPLLVLSQHEGQLLKVWFSADGSKLHTITFNVQGSMSINGMPLNAFKNGEIHRVFDLETGKYEITAQDDTSTPLLRPKHEPNRWKIAKCGLGCAINYVASDTTFAWLPNDFSSAADSDEVIAFGDGPYVEIFAMASHHGMVLHEADLEIGEFLFQLEDYGRGAWWIQRSKKGLDPRKNVSQRRTYAHRCMMCGVSYQLNGEHSKAAAEFQEAISVAEAGFGVNEESAALETIGAAFSNMGECLFALEHYESASKSLQYAVGLHYQRAKSGHVKAIHSALLAVSRYFRVCCACHDWPMAVRLFQSASTLSAGPSGEPLPGTHLFFSQMTQAMMELPQVEREELFSVAGELADLLRQLTSYTVAAPVGEKSISKPKLKLVGSGHLSVPTPPKVIKVTPWHVAGGTSGPFLASEFPMSEDSP